MDLSSSVTSSPTHLELAEDRGRVLRSCAADLNMLLTDVLELSFLSSLAGFWKPAEAGDWFWARNAVEYNAPAPDADVRYGSVRRGHWMQAQQVAVVQIPSADGLVNGLAIKVESTRVPGAVAWVNVSKGSTRFADMDRSSNHRHARRQTAPY